jgi:hypothetical protein
VPPIKNTTLSEPQGARYKQSEEILVVINIPLTVCCDIVQGLAAQPEPVGWWTGTLACLNFGTTALEKSIRPVVSVAYSEAQTCEDYIIWITRWLTLCIPLYHHGCNQYLLLLPEQTVCINAHVQVIVVCKISTFGLQNVWVKKNAYSHNNVKNQLILDLFNPLFSHLL